MKRSLLTAIAAAAFAAPAFAAPLAIDFERDWAYGDMVGSTYAAQGAVFSNVMGVSNDANFTYYTGAPSPRGVAAPVSLATGDRAWMNNVLGMVGSLSFAYSSTANATVRAYSGLDGTGTLLGSVLLTANTMGAPYDAWNRATLTFGGFAQSFDFTELANVGGFDNITGTIPEAGSGFLALAALGALAAVTRRRVR